MSTKENVTIFAWVGVATIVFLSIYYLYGNRAALFSSHSHTEETTEQTTDEDQGA